MYFSARTAIRSAADIAEVGCPDPLTAVARIASTRSCCPSSRQRSARRRVGTSVVMDMRRWSLLRVCCENTRLTLGGRAVSNLAAALLYRRERHACCDPRPVPLDDRYGPFRGFRLSGRQRQLV